MEPNEHTKIAYHLRNTSRRRLITVSAGVLTAGLAGCAEISANADGTRGSRTKLENFAAGEIRVGTEEQRISIGLAQVDPEEQIDIYIDVTSLTESNIGIDDLGVVAESRYSIGWLVADAEITKGERTVVQVTLTFDDEVEIDETGTVSVELTGLETSAGSHKENQTYSATISSSNGEPDFTSGKTTTFEIIDPDQIENVLRVDPSDLRIGENSQLITISIDRATDNIDFRLDLSPLTEMGVDIDRADVVVEDSGGERRNDEGEVNIEVTDAAVVEGTVQLGITTTAYNLFVDLRVTGLDTQDAEATAAVAYPVYVGERPSEPTESGRFSLSGATA